MEISGGKDLSFKSFINKPKYQYLLNKMVILIAGVPLNLQTSVELKPKK